MPQIGFDKCLLVDGMICDGISQCLTDECDCKHKVVKQTEIETDVFWCADGSGCISFSNLCDSFLDCVDGSDECMCNDAISCNAVEYCITKRHYCAHTFA